MHTVKGKAMPPLVSVMMTIFTGFVAFTVGGLWDTQVHAVGGGHDDFAPPHLLILGASLCFAAGGAVTLVVHRGYGLPDKPALAVTAWSAISLWVSLWAVDKAWHLLFGLDQSAWSPPHLLCFLSVFASLWGLLVVCRARAEMDARHDAYVLGLGGAILVVALFAFAEHDLPGSTALATARPPWTYSAGGAVLLATCLLLLRGITKVAWGVTMPAVGAWLFFWLTGVGIERASGLPYIEPPFPLWIPAVVLDRFVATYEEGAFDAYRWSVLRAAVVTTTVTFWAMVAWAALYTQLPHQISGDVGDWLVWYAVMIVPACACQAVLASWFVHYTASIAFMRGRDAC